MLPARAGVGLGVAKEAVENLAGGGPGDAGVSDVTSFPAGSVGRCRKGRGRSGPRGDPPWDSPAEALAVGGVLPRRCLHGRRLVGADGLDPHAWLAERLPAPVLPRPAPCQGGRHVCVGVRVVVGGTVFGEVALDGERTRSARARAPLVGPAERSGPVADRWRGDAHGRERAHDGHGDLPVAIHQRRRVRSDRGPDAGGAAVGWGCAGRADTARVDGVIVRAPPVHHRGPLGVGTAVRQAARGGLFPGGDAVIPHPSPAPPPLTPTTNGGSGLFVTMRSRNSAGTITR
jgi:hypothetical protein